MDAKDFTFRSLGRSDNVDLANGDSTGLSWSMQNKRGSSNGEDGGGPKRCLQWVLLPGCVIIFLIFAIVGTSSIVTVMQEQDHVAGLIGGKALPKPPPPPPRRPRPPPAPFSSPPPPPSPKPPPPPNRLASLNSHGTPQGRLLRHRQLFANSSHWMYCNLDVLLEGCLKPRKKNPERYALLIEGFPRARHKIDEFAKLLYLLQKHEAKATFVVDWCEIREKGLTTAVGDIMKLVHHHEHEVAIQFKSDTCGVYNLRQHAVEALHFLQRVYGITVVSAKVGFRPLAFSNALESIGVSIVDGVCNQVVLRDNDNVLSDVEHVLAQRVHGSFVRVSDMN